MILAGIRYIGHEIGRFVSRDIEREGENWFVYVDNRPAMVVDPTGAAAWRPGGVAFVNVGRTIKDNDLFIEACRRECKRFVNQKLRANRFQSYYVSPMTEQMAYEQLVQSSTKVWLLCAHGSTKEPRMSVAPARSYLRAANVENWRQQQKNDRFDRAPLRYVGLISCRQGTSANLPHWIDAFNPPTSRGASLEVAVKAWDRAVWSSEIRHLLDTVVWPDIVAHWGR